MSSLRLQVWRPVEIFFNTGEGTVAMKDQKQPQME